MTVVFWKELADHFSSRRFMILLIIIILSGLWATYATGQAIRQNTDTIPPQYAFLLLLTSSGETLFSLATFLGFFGPLVGITLGFDSISGEYARGTLSRVLSQPIYRDSLINGKFLAGLTTVAVLWGYGIAPSRLFEADSFCRHRIAIWFNSFSARCEDFEVCPQRTADAFGLDFEAEYCGGR